MDFGESAKKRLHAIKLIGREALDWRAHEKSPDYLKLAGEPLKSAQELVHEDWLVDKNSTDYVKACYLHEQEKEAQRLQAEQAKELAQQAEIARIQAEKEQAKAENVRLEALGKLKIAEANAEEQKAKELAQNAEIARIQAENEQAKADAEKLEALENQIAEANAKAQNTWFALAGLAFVIIAALATFWTYNEGQKSAALISLPLVASKLPPWEALDVTNSVAQKGGKEFRYMLAHALEAMENRYLFSPRESNVVIAGQGTAIFQFDNSNQMIKN